MGSFVVDERRVVRRHCKEAEGRRSATAVRVALDCFPPLSRGLKASLAMTSRAMNDAILREIADFCRRTGVAESTFGRRAVNDGKLASRLRNGGRITTDTLDRIRAFMTENVSGE